ncbi:sugar-binding domain-containing protein [Streptomyces sp. NPDC058424]|uniref:sugar-binding domain-containing protein n=1 Tax=Streptomyces sp. NPDC058424 TaxID=3346491 RepID=UPI00365440BB
MRRRALHRFTVTAVLIALVAGFIIDPPRIGLGATGMANTAAALATSSPGTPDPGSPGPLAFPALTPATFATPPATARVKFRWWQPLADTDDAEIQREVATMAGNFGGGFEQNGFAVSNGPNSGRPARCEGCTSQFYNFAASQEYGKQVGWGSPLWSHRTEVYQQAAAQHGVIGDMNEGSRWDNQVPTVYSPNQEANAQDLSYGVQQYQPGQDPSGELPPVTAPPLGGQSTKLTVTAHPGDTNIQAQSIAGLLAGDQITLGRGTAAETATIRSVGTASPAVPLSQGAAAGSTVVHVAPADMTNGSPGTTVVAPTGVPGTPQAAAQFVPGQKVTIGSGADEEEGVIAGIGTYDMADPDAMLYTGSPTAEWVWNTPNSRGSAAAGTIYLRKTFTTPPGVTHASLRINADDAEVTYVNGVQVASSAYPNWSTSQNVDITKHLKPAGQANVIAVAATNASAGAAGVIAAVRIDGSDPQRIATDSSWKAWPASMADPPGSPTPPAGNWNTVGYDDSAWENAVSTGAYGISPWGTTPDSAQPTGPTTLMLPPGESGTVAAPKGTTNVELATTTGFLKGDTITIGSGTAAESRKITSVGGAGRGTTLSAAASAGGLQISVASASGLQAGQHITIGSRDSREDNRIATISGTSLTLYTRLQNSHAQDDPVALKSIGVSFTPPLSNSHNVGEEAIDTGTGITLKTPLARNHPAGATFVAPGTGVTLTAPLTKTHPAGANDAVTTSLSAASAAGDTNIKLAGVANLAAGDRLTIGRPGYTQTVTIKDVGTAGAAGTGVTFSPALSEFHYSGDPVIDSTNASVTNAGGGVSDIQKESLVAALLVQCLPPSTADSMVPPTTSLSAAAKAGATTVTIRSATNLAVGDRLTIDTGSTAETRTISAISGTTVTLASPLGNAHAAGDGAWDTCTSAPTGGTRILDPASTINVTDRITPNALTFTEGTLNHPGPLPTGNGEPWKLIDFYSHGDTQVAYGGTATTPNQWLGHLSAASAKAMTDYFDNHILNDPATKAAIAYQNAHTGRPAVFEDSLENSNNLNWVSDMMSSWQHELGYDPVKLLPALAATGRNATGTPAFDYPQSNGQGATLGWRVRNDYGHMWNHLYINRYVKTIDKWAASRGLVARFQSYGDPIDAGEAAAHTGIPESEHYEFADADETQQFKVSASGMYQASTPHFLSNECCEAQGQVWADPFGINGTGSGASPNVTEPNAKSVYADQAGGASQIIYHGWPYTTGVAGMRAVWPGNSYGGNDTYSAANGPNQPQFADDRNNNIAIARHNLVLRQGEPSFDVAVFHEDFGLGGQGQDNLTNGWNMGTVTSNGVTTRPTSGKLIRSSSSLAQEGYLYGYVSPAFFRYPTARFAVDPSDASSGRKVLFPGHGDYKALVLYDQSVMPVDVAHKIATLAGQGLPVVIIGQVPDAAPTAAGGTLAGMSAADAEVRAAMAKVTAAPNTRVVADATAAGSQSADSNAPEALVSLGITASTRMNTPSAKTKGTATPVLGIRRHDDNLDYYQLFNMSSTETVHPSVTLTGHGTPYLLDAWTGKITPIANYTSTGDRVTLSLRIGPGNAVIVAVTPSNKAFKAKPKLDVHATGTTANATRGGVDNVVYDSSGNLAARAATTGTYATTLSDGTTVTSNITVPDIDPSSTVSLIGGVPTLTNWQLSVDSWTQTPSGDPTKTLHTPIPAGGSFPVSPLNGVSNGSLPSWTAITPQNIPGLDPANNLTNVAGIGTYTTSFALPSDWSASTAGVYLNIGAAADTVNIWVNGKAVAGVDQNDRNQVDIGPYLRAGSNELKITVATPLRNAVAVAPATPETGQVPNSSAKIGDLQVDISPPAPGFTRKIATVGLIGPVTLTPYGQSAPLN